MNFIQLRQTLRDRRKKLSEETVFIASASITKKTIMLPAFLNSEHIACYFSNENEISTVQIVYHAQQQNKKIYFPVLENKKLLFCRVDENTQYEENKFGILEPVCEEKDLFAIEKIELFFIPLVAFDVQCHRIGRGTGYYDRALVSRHKNAVLIGLAYEFQRIDRIIPESWDIPMDFVVTEENTYRSTPTNSTNHAIS